MKRKFVWVRWRDAAVDSGDLYVDDVEAHDPLATLETVGWLVSETDEALTLATTFSPLREKWRVTIGIPRKSILKKKVITLDAV